MGETTRRLLSLRLPFLEDDSERTTSPFHAVEIRSARGCAAAEPLHGRRYLSNEAPILPLPDCDRRTRCSCTYRHHEDRRDGPRRSAESSAFPDAEPVPAHEDQRRVRGRRTDDREPVDATGILEDTYYDYFVDKKRDSEPPPS